MALESILGIVLVEIMKVQREVPRNIAQAKLTADGVNLLVHAIGRPLTARIRNLPAVVASRTNLGSVRVKIPGVPVPAAKRA